MVLPNDVIAIYSNKAFFLATPFMSHRYLYLQVLPNAVITIYSAGAITYCSRTIDFYTTKLYYLITLVNSKAILW